MSDTGAKYPLTAADDNAVGTGSWTDVNKIKANDGDFAGCPTIGTTHYLKATNFNFSIPIGATINGIVVIINRYNPAGGGLGDVNDGEIRIVKSNGSIGTTNKSVGNTWESTAYSRQYGGEADKWGESWAYSDINSSNFGVVLSAIIQGGRFTGTAYVGFMTITVYYTELISAQTRPFAVYTDSEPAGTTKMGNILTGDTSQPYGAGQPANTDWYMGPDETNGYIISKDNGTEPTFWRSTTKTDNDFIALANSLKGGTTLTTTTEAANWLIANDYYYDHPDEGVSLILDFDNQGARSDTYTTNTETVNADATIYITLSGQVSSVTVIVYINDTPTTIWDGTVYPNQTVDLNVADEVYFHVAGHPGGDISIGTVTIQLDDSGGDVVDTFTYDVEVTGGPA